jgi:hypothetical protein
LYFLRHHPIGLAGDGVVRPSGAPLSFLLY